MPGLAAFKNGFFDRALVLDAVDAATRRVLSKFGAFVRTRARSSIRARKAASKPGSPPSSHVGTLKRLILFAYDASTGSVVVGPALFASATRTGGQTTPETLEYGGPVTKTLYQLSGGRWVGSGSPLLKGQRAGRPARTLTGRVAERPFMRPAEAAERPKFAELFRDSVTK